MLIFEVESPDNPDSAKLMTLVRFLSGRASDTDAKKEISVTAFVNAAKNLGIDINIDPLNDADDEDIATLISQPPLSNLLLPYEPGSKMIKFKGNTDTGNNTMPVNQAEQIVAQNAKSAMPSNLK
jgi:hypothetical protein